MYTVILFVHFLSAFLAPSLACSPAAPPPIKNYVEETNRDLLEGLDTSNYKNYGLEFINDYCPSQVPAATKFFNETNTQPKNLDIIKKKHILMARIRSDLLFTVLLHDAMHRDILCEAVIIEHSGRKQSCPRQASKNAMTRIMTINTYESEVSIGGFITRRQPGGDGEPPTPPPNRKPKLPDDAPDINNVDEEDKEETEEEVIELSSSLGSLELNVPVSRTVSSTSCESKRSISSVVDIQFIEQFDTSNRPSSWQNLGVRARAHFPVSQFGNRVVPRDPVDIPPMPYSLRGGLTDVQGLVADTPDYTNTCNIDSFLTHLILLSYGDPQLARKLFVHENSRIERGLTEIIDRYWSGVRNRENHVSLSNEIKGMWIKAANLPHGKPKRNRPVNMYGSEYSNVYEPLKQHTILVTTTVCRCPSSPYRLTIRNQLPPTFSMATQIHRYAGAAPTRISPSDRCAQCQNGDNTEIRYSFVADTTWVLSFECPKDVYTSFDPQNLAVELAMPDAFRPAEFVDFDLGYLSYSTQTPSTSGATNDLFHQVSFHFIGGQWFFYDGDSNDGHLRYMTQNAMIEMIQREQLSFLAANYFRRRFVSQRPRLNRPTPKPADN